MSRSNDEYKYNVLKKKRIIDGYDAIINFIVRRQIVNKRNVYVYKSCVLFNDAMRRCAVAQ